MYGAHDDPYVYPGTHVLKNSENIKDAARLADFELEVVTVRAKSELPNGRFDAKHYRQIHHHLFQDIYAWAGHYRTIRIAKNGNWFCYPDHIDSQMMQLIRDLKSDDYLRNLPREGFGNKAARFLSNLNAIHPFRDGNGRTQVTFLAVLATFAGHPINIERLNPDRFLKAMIGSFKGDIKPLEAEVTKILL